MKCDQCSRTFYPNLLIIISITLGVAEREISESERREIEHVINMIKIALNQVLAPLNKKIMMVDEYDPIILERWK